MNRLDRFQEVAGELFEAVLVNFGDNLYEGNEGEIVFVSGWKKDTLEIFERKLRDEFGEDALVERITELQKLLSDAQSIVRQLRGERPLFPEEAAHV